MNNDWFIRFWKFQEIWQTFLQISMFFHFLKKFADGRHYFNKLDQKKATLAEK